MVNFPKSTPEYQNLKVITEPWDVTYFVNSRRFGQSLGINLLGNNKKICSYDCKYCDLGPTEIKMNEIKKSGFFASPEDMIQKIQEGFHKAKSANKPVDVIMIVGNGEPTLYPDLDIVVPEIKKLRDELFPNRPIGILSNGSHLDVRKNLKAVNELDLKIIKLDAGNDKTLKLINDPLVKDSVEKLITSFRRIKNLTIQSLFVNGAYDNTSNVDLDEWIEVIGMIKPDEIQIYTIDRIPAYPGLIKAEEDTLYTIAAKLEKKTRIKAKVFY